MPCSNREFLRVLQTSKFAHWPTTIDMKNAEYTVYCTPMRWANVWEGGPKQVDVNNDNIDRHHINSNIQGRPCMTRNEGIVAIQIL